MEIDFKTEMWIYPGQNAWHFITVPSEYFDDIRQIADAHKKGFGSVKVEVTVGKSTWKTSIFPDNKSKTYVMPVKKEIRFKIFYRHHEHPSAQLRLCS